MHVMQLLFFFFFFGYMNDHFGHLPRLNYGCKIECLQVFWVRKINLFHGHLYNSFKFNPLLKKKKKFH